MQFRWQAASCDCLYRPFGRRLAWHYWAWFGQRDNSGKSQQRAAWWICRWITGRRVAPSGTVSGLKFAKKRPYSHFAFQHLTRNTDTIPPSLAGGTTPRALLVFIRGPVRPVRSGRKKTQLLGARFRRGVGSTLSRVIRTATIPNATFAGRISFLALVRMESEADFCLVRKRPYSFFF